MAPVREKVLEWLYSVLHEYHDPQRTYTDSARALATHPSLSPRTEVYTSDTGLSALLLTLSGTLPVVFRGNTYRFPVKLCIPHAYPHEAPLVYVVPSGRDMVVRPGQHVGVDGRVYHAYLRDWPRMWDRASVAEFLDFLQQVFAKEPPVVNKAQQDGYPPTSAGTPPQQQQQRSVGPSSAPPPLPPKQRLGNIGPDDLPSTNPNAPPPRPPKPGDDSAETPGRDRARDGPPLPPLPHERTQSHARHDTSSSREHVLNAVPSRPQSQAQSYVNVPRYQDGQPLGSSLPPQPLASQQQYPPNRSNHDRSSPVSPVSPVNRYAELPETKYTYPSSSMPQQPWAPQPPYFPLQQRHAVPQGTALPPPHQNTYHHASHRHHGFHTPHSTSSPGHQQVSHPQKPPPPPDLLTSDPFDLTLPTSTPSAVPAPPIPPNPEKEHFLQALSTTLVQQSQHKVSQNLAALAPLQAQHSALLTARARLDAEMRQLEHLAHTLEGNESMLYAALRDCDATIASAQSKPQPPIDDVLVAPTLVAQQLWTLCADEAGIREAMYMLQQAVDAGRVTGEVFVRSMRALGREAFLKRALARKCALGLGLDLGLVRRA